MYRKNLISVGCLAHTKEMLAPYMGLIGMWVWDQHCWEPHCPGAQHHPAQPSTVALIGLPGINGLLVPALQRLRHLLPARAEGERWRAGLSINPAGSGSFGVPGTLQQHCHRKGEGRGGLERTPRSAGAGGMSQRWGSSWVSRVGSAPRDDADEWEWMAAQRLRNAFMVGGSLRCEGHLQLTPHHIRVSIPGWGQRDVASPQHLLPQPLCQLGTVSAPIPFSSYFRTFSSFCDALWLQCLSLGLVPRPGV